MNAKSTPLSHLPSTALPPSQEIMPGDDDTTIQAVLNEIAGTSGAGGPPPPSQQQQQMAPPPPMQQQPITQQQAAFMAAHQAQQQAAALSGVDTTTLLAMLGQGPSAPIAAVANPSSGSGNMMNLLMKVLTQDFKLATIVFAIYIAVSFIPVSNILGKYFDLNRVPYAELIIKGVVAAIVVTLLMKSFVK